MEEEQTRTIYCVRTSSGVRWFASKEDAQQIATQAGSNAEVEAVVL